MLPSICGVGVGRAGRRSARPGCDPRGRRPGCRPRAWTWTAIRYRPVGRPLRVRPLAALHGIVVEVVEGGDGRRLDGRGASPAPATPTPAAPARGRSVLTGRLVGRCGPGHVLDRRCPPRRRRGAGVAGGDGAATGRGPCVRPDDAAGARRPEAGASSLPVVSAAASRAAAGRAGVRRRDRDAGGGFSPSVPASARPATDRLSAAGGRSARRSASGAPSVTVAVAPSLPVAAEGRRRLRPPREPRRRRLRGASPPSTDRGPVCSAAARMAAGSSEPDWGSGILSSDIEPFPYAARGRASALTATTQSGTPEAGERPGARVPRFPWGLSWRAFE